MIKQLVGFIHRQVLFLAELVEEMPGLYYLRRSPCGKGEMYIDIETAYGADCFIEKTGLLKCQEMSQSETKHKRIEILQQTKTH